MDEGGREGEEGEGGRGREGGRKREREGKEGGREGLTRYSSSMPLVSECGFCSWRCLNVLRRLWMDTSVFPIRISSRTASWMKMY